jgi:cytochrome P450
MALHPDIQKCAQEEIDLVVGRDRLPELLDRPRLPYLESVLLELFRWNPVGPLGDCQCLSGVVSSDRT